MSRPTTTLARHTLIYAAGSAIGGVSRLVLVPVIARKLAPEEYGVFALLLAVTNFLHLVFELGLVTALIRAHNEDEDPAARADQAVRAWRSEGTLPFPDFAAE